MSKGEIKGEIWKKKVGGLVGIVFGRDEQDLQDDFCGTVLASVKGCILVVLRVFLLGGLSYISHGICEMNRMLLGGFGQSGCACQRVAGRC